MKKDDHVDGFRSTKEVLRSFLDGLYSKTEDPDTKNFIQEEIDSLDSEPDDSNSNLLLAVVRKKSPKEFAPCYIDGLEEPWDRYKDDIFKFFMMMLLSGRTFHHGYGAELDENGHPTAWYLYFE